VHDAWAPVGPRNRAVSGWSRRRHRSQRPLGRSRPSPGAGHRPKNPGKDDHLASGSAAPRMRRPSVTVDPVAIAYPQSRAALGSNLGEAVNHAAGRLRCATRTDGAELPWPKSDHRLGDGSGVGATRRLCHSQGPAVRPVPRHLVTQLPERQRLPSRVWLRLMPG